MKKSNFSLSLAAACYFAACRASHADPAPLWEFNFNDATSGSTAVNTGSDPNAANASLTMYSNSANGTPVDDRVPGGPSGLSTDMAFSTVPPPDGPTQYGFVPAAQTAGIDQLNQITVSGWYNLAEPLPVLNYTRSFLIGDRPSVYSEGLVVDFNAQGNDFNQLGLEINDYYSPHYGGDAYWEVPNSTTDGWHFWALTYDGTQQTNNVSLYTGTVADSVTAAGAPKSIGHNVSTNPDGTIFNDGANFVLGADPSNEYDNPVVGLQDNVRIYDGVLTPAQIESVRESDLTINLGPTDQMVVPPGTGTRWTLAVTIAAGGTLDITDNTLDIDFTGNADPLATIRGYLRTAYNGGNWSGTGLTSSTVQSQVAGALQNGGGVWSLGYADGNVDSGTTAAANHLLVEPALAGDANLSGNVDFIDLGIVAQNLGAIDSDWAHGDFNYDGSVNFLDIGLLAQNLNYTDIDTPLSELIANPSASLTAQWNLAVAELESNDPQATPANLPEPGTLGLLTVAAWGILARRRRSPVESA